MDSGKVLKMFTFRPESVFTMDQNGCSRCSRISVHVRQNMQYYTKPKFLLIDEVGYLSYSNRHADLLFEIISRRYEQSATLVTTNRPFSEWNEVFPNAACVVSLIDRLVHHSEVIAIEGDSYRMKEAHERAAKQHKSRSGKAQ